MYPIPDPIAADANPADGPKRMLVTNMIIGAKVMVEIGGGTGMAVAVNTAIKADMTDVKATLFV
jgi:hypothetical protein